MKSKLLKQAILRLAELIRHPDRLSAADYKAEVEAIAKLFVDGGAA